MAAGETALSDKQFAAADKHYSEALRLAQGLPKPEPRVLNKILLTLSEIKNAEQLYAEAESLLTQRVTLLEASPDEGDHLLGLALFDLETFYGTTSQISKASRIANRAVEFYRSCSETEAWRVTCDRRLADVQGMMGAILFKEQKFEEATPWFEAVVARKDEDVRPEVMLVSLQAYAKLLWDSGHIAESRQVARRAETFRAKHPEAEP